MENNIIHNIKVREDDGRETIKRFHAQFRAASLEVIKILENDSIDMVYCDYHDDFVVRENIGEDYKYNFYQVKTKGKQNYLWNIKDLFGLHTRKKEVNLSLIKDSFVGKMLLHTVNFKTSCTSITFLTNINLDDNTEKLRTDIENDTFENKHTLILIENFNKCFLAEDDEIIEEKVKEHLKKLKFDTNNVYLLDDNTDDFYEKMRTKILRYSEIDLQYIEAKEITDSLIALIERKSRVKLSDLSKEELEVACGIGLEDILSVLSISKNAYDKLLEGGDNQAIKNASILQRTLADTVPENLEYCSKVKTDWDNWLRKNRHIIPEFDLNELITELNEAVTRSSVLGSVSFKKLMKEVKSLEQRVEIDSLNKELLLGGSLSFLVRRLS